MLTVTNGWIKNSISHDRITKVVNSAKLNANTGVEDESRRMGPLDSFIDHYFCGDAKKIAMDILYELARNTTLLNNECNKPEGERRRDLTDQFQRDLDDSQKRFRLLTPGKSIEFGQHGASPHKLDLCYLIYRDKNLLSPVGIPLYAKPEASNADSDVDTFVRTFSTLEDIQFTDLNHIRINGRFKLNNEIFEVRFTHQNEPILMCREISEQNGSVQEKLSKLWINNLARQKLIELAEIQKVDSALKLKVIFLGLGTGEERSKEEMSASETWNQNAQVIQNSFGEAIKKMQKSNNNEQTRLALELQRLSALHQPTVADKDILTRIQLEIENLATKQNKLNKNIARLKAEFTALCHLISYCTDCEMIQNLTLRMTNFLSYIVRLSTSSMGHKELAEFNVMLNAQSAFLKNFGPEEVASCTDLFDPPATDRSRNACILPPTSDLLRNELRQLMTDPTRSWDEIETAMKRLKIEQEILLSNKIKQVEFGRYLDGLIKEKIYIDTAGKYSAGLDKESGLTYFTPETYSRIISLEKIRDNLLNAENNFTREEIEIMGANISHHFKKIAAENLAFIEKQKQRYFSFTASNYKPIKDKDGNPIDHDQWTWQFGIASYKSKSGPIIAGLREAHKMTKANIDALIKRGDRITAVTPKIGQYHENTKVFKKASTKLRKDM